MSYFSPQYTRKNNWKIISNRLQVHTIISNFIHPSQLKSTKQYLTTDTGIFLNYLIQIEWVKGLHTSILAFNIVQFFAFMNHWPLSIILTKVGFDLNIFQFFSSYLIHRQTQYVWNSFTSSFFKTDVGVGQGSALLLWQPLITKTNDHTSGKFLKLDIKWEVHKRTRQGASAKLESYIY